MNRLVGLATGVALKLLASSAKPPSGRARAAMAESKVKRLVLLERTGRQLARHGRLSMIKAQDLIARAQRDLRRGKPLHVQGRIAAP